MFVFVFVSIIAFHFSNSRCNHNYFALNEKNCTPWLNCNAIQNLHIGDLIGFGAVKKVYMSMWEDTPVALIFLNDPSYVDDFHHGLDLLIRLQPSEFVTVLIGFCSESHVYVTKFYPMGTLLGFEKHLPLDPILNFKSRFKLCLNYIRIIEFIHSVFERPLIMCDSNSLHKTLEQYLFKDDDSLVLNDVDALTEVNPSGIICGHKEIGGQFVAPEQLWPFQGSYDDKLMIPYNEKTDIWKIPAVCKHILGNSRETHSALYSLFSINKSCYQRKPSVRPNASLVLNSYEEIYNNLFYKDEL